MKLYPYPKVEWTQTTATTAGRCACSGLDIVPGDAVYVTDEAALMGHTVLVSQYERYCRTKGFVD